MSKKNKDYKELVCQSKHTYKTLGEARRRAQAAAWRYSGKRHRPYFCDVCRHYHLASQTQNLTQHKENR